MKGLYGLAALLLTFAVVSPVRAASLPDGGVTAAEVANILQKQGYKAEITTDKDGDPRVEMDMDVQHGTTTEAIANDLDRWVSVLAAFTKNIGW